MKQLDAPTRFFVGLRVPASLLCLAALATLAACAQPYGRDGALGETVREAQVMQTVPPSPGRTDHSALTTDGVIAVHGVTRYQQSWISPSSPMQGLNAQPGAGTSTAPASMAMPR